ncbi:hypothetical protein CDO52_00900 [Nocardiopsis gilva YIM 90087]|uniref:Uncharacterized protein n=1 Tax=Nocardiopsis gilva YIM 90087 TaxID=1235441 RepID=A0A223S0B5_9ACTN|nr:hypothetical protein [Nocardiopsis gilva]ASU81537.1 hypothetical protein CDO52_00900 [Nocardiopsis gilva YIM 90087]
MGYDMTWENDSDQDGSYFRLNIFGMARYAEAMYRLGMLYPADPGAFPEAHDHGTTWEHVDAVQDLEGGDGGRVVSGPAAAAARAYLDQVNAHLAQHPGEAAGIPSFKFSTNDGWHVTPEECRAAVKAARDATPNQLDANFADGDRQYWDEWIAYLERAADHGGFRVF